MGIVMFGVHISGCLIARGTVWIWDRVDLGPCGFGTVWIWERVDLGSVIRLELCAIVNQDRRR